MRSFVFKDEKQQLPLSEQRGDASGFWRRAAEFCNENMILFAVGLLLLLVAAILIAWFQYQSGHAEFGVFVSQGL